MVTKYGGSLFPEIFHNSYSHPWHIKRVEATPFIFDNSYDNFYYWPRGDSKLVFPEHKCVFKPLHYSLRGDVLKNTHTHKQQLILLIYSELFSLTRVFNCGGSTVSNEKIAGWLWMILICFSKFEKITTFPWNNKKSRKVYHVADFSLHDQIRHLQNRI